MAIDLIEANERVRDVFVGLHGRLERHAQHVASGLEGIGALHEFLGRNGIPRPDITGSASRASELSQRSLDALEHLAPQVDTRVLSSDSAWRDWYRQVVDGRASELPVDGVGFDVALPTAAFIIERSAQAKGAVFSARVAVRSAFDVAARDGDHRIDDLARPFNELDAVVRTTLYRYLENAQRQLEHSKRALVGVAKGLGREVEANCLLTMGVSRAGTPSVAHSLARASQPAGFTRG